MGSFSSNIEKNLTKKAQGIASDMLQKLTKKGEASNVSTVTFPVNLENQAQSTYMAIYIYDNQSNKANFNTAVFNSSIDVDDTTYEIKAITTLKNKAKEQIDYLKKEAKDTLKSWTKSSKDWLKSQFESEVKSKIDTAEELTIGGYTIKEIADWTDEWLIPKRKTNESSALKNSLDNSENLLNGFKLEKVIHIQMPSSTISYKYENGWESVDTSNYNTIKTLFSGLSNVFSDFNRAKQQLSPVAEKVKQAIGDMITGGGYAAYEQASSRLVYNPVLVFNYKVPTPRTFSYSFTLYPRNKDELYVLYNMIQMLKYYSLPDINVKGQNLGSGARPVTFRYPAKFMIRFYTNGYENKWFPKTLALGLTSIDETLTGDGGDMAFFENYFDTASGNPPRVVKLTLTFKELGLMSREYANEGY